MLSYEVFMGLSLMGVVMHGRLVQPRATSSRPSTACGSVVPQFLGFVVFLIAGIAETRRLPFDLPEAESELVAGFHTEYSGMKFGMFFIGEYLGIMLISAMIVTLFFGGWLGPVAAAARLVPAEDVRLRRLLHPACARRCRGRATIS